MTAVNVANNNPSIYLIIPYYLSIQVEIGEVSTKKLKLFDVPCPKKSHATAEPQEGKKTFASNRFTTTSNASLRYIIYPNELFMISCGCFVHKLRWWLFGSGYAQLVEPPIKRFWSFSYAYCGCQFIIKDKWYRSVEGKKYFLLIALVKTLGVQRIARKT